MTEVRVALSEEIDRYLGSLVRTGPFANKAELVRAALVSFAGEAGPMAQGFDRETCYAPDGRVYQLEYAREAALRGLPGVGIVYEGGVVLAALDTGSGAQVGGKLVRGSSKIRRVSDRLGMLASGLVADAHMAFARLRDAKPKTTEEAVEVVVRFYWEHSVDRTKRPLGAGLLLASALDGAGRLFYIDPSAAFVEYDAAAVGDGGDERMEALEKRYKRRTAKEAERFALEVLGNPEKADVVRIPASA